MSSSETEMVQSDLSQALLTIKETVENEQENVPVSLQCLLEAMNSNEKLKSAIVLLATSPVINLAKESRLCGIEEESVKALHQLLKKWHEKQQQIDTLAPSTSVQLQGDIDIEQLKKDIGNKEKVLKKKQIQLADLADLFTPELCQEVTCENKTDNKLLQTIAAFEAQQDVVDKSHGLVATKKEQDFLPDNITQLKQLKKELNYLEMHKDLFFIYCAFLYTPTATKDFAIDLKFFDKSQEFTITEDELKEKFIHKTITLCPSSLTDTIMNVLKINKDDLLKTYTNELETRINLVRSMEALESIRNELIEYLATQTAVELEKQYAGVKACEHKHPCTEFLTKIITHEDNSILSKPHKSSRRHKHTASISPAKKTRSAATSDTSGHQHAKDKSIKREKSTKKNSSKDKKVKNNNKWDYKKFPGELKPYILFLQQNHNDRKLTTNQLYNLNFNTIARYRNTQFDSPWLSTEQFRDYLEAYQSRKYRQNILKQEIVTIEKHLSIEGLNLSTLLDNQQKLQKQIKELDDMSQTVIEVQSTLNDEEKTAIIIEALIDSAEEATLLAKKYNYDLTLLAQKCKLTFNSPTNIDIYEAIFSIITVDTMTENTQVLKQLLRAGQIINQHITSNKEFYCQVILKLIELKKPTATIQYLYDQLTMHHSQSEAGIIIDESTNRTMLHLAIDTEKFDLAEHCLFNKKECFNLTDRSEQKHSPLSLLAQYTVATDDIKKLINQLTLDHLCLQHNDKTLYEMAKPDLDKLIKERILALAINEITNDEFANNALNLLAYNGLQFHDITYEAINKSLLPLDHKIRLFLFKDDSGAPILPDQLNGALKTLLVETVINCLKYDKSHDAQQLLLENNLSVQSLIDYYYPNGKQRHEIPTKVHDFLTQVQKNNLENTISFKVAGEKVPDINYNHHEHDLLTQQQWALIRQHIYKKYPELNTGNPYLLMPIEKQRKLYQLLNLGFDVINGYQVLPDEPNLDKLAQSQPQNFLYSQYQDYYHNNEIESDDALLNFIYDDKLKEEFISLSKRAAECELKYPIDSRSIQHAAITFLLMAKHGESSRAEEIKSSPLYTTINHPRAKNIFHNLFLWLTSFLTRTTSSQKIVNLVSNNLSHQGHSPTLFKPEKSTKVTKLSSLDDVSSEQINSHVYIENVGLYYITNGGLKNQVCDFDGNNALPVVAELNERFNKPSINIESQSGGNINQVIYIEQKRLSKSIIEGGDYEQNNLQSLGVDNHCLPRLAAVTA